MGVRCREGRLSHPGVGERAQETDVFRVRRLLVQVAGSWAIVALNILVLYYMLLNKLS